MRVPDNPQDSCVSPDILKALVPGAGLATHAGVVTPAGVDDCGVVEFGDRFLVATTDFVNAWPAMFQLGVGTMRDYGALLARISLSDLLGSGAVPVAMTLNLGLPPELCRRTEYLRILAGASAVCETVGCAIIGGDTKGSSALSCSSTAFGYVTSRDRLRLCGGLKAGHLVAVSGPLGAFNMAVIEAAGTSRLFAECRAEIERVLCHQVLPVALARELNGAPPMGAGTDISDGLGADLHNLMERSGLGLRIRAEAIPTTDLVKVAAERRQLPAWSYAFAGGGDHQFVFTGSPSAFASLREAHTIIGEVLSTCEGVLTVGGADYALPGFGHTDYAFASFVEEIENGLRVATHLRPRAPY